MLISFHYHCTAYLLLYCNCNARTGKLVPDKRLWNRMWGLRHWLEWKHLVRESCSSQSSHTYLERQKLLPPLSYPSTIQVSHLTETYFLKSWKRNRTRKKWIIYVSNWCDVSHRVYFLSNCYLIHTAVCKLTDMLCTLIADRVGQLSHIFRLPLHCFALCENLLTPRRNIFPSNRGRKNK